ncbi:hypothetical protein [Streptomyces sp. JV180]|uniref:hypothetical protein n=1 Tax=Streptomyces sp. JV180 TaxID=858634 RepID=UPI00168BBFCF|nr:hypothetical protein [Streptomyces sp. JV180]MBD3550583.1 hypothetical protein [Streptomyces sp. JV180]
MTSVRETSATASPSAPAPRGPKCNGPGCGKPLVHIPGKRPKVYCSPACKMRAKRAIERASETTTNGAGHQSPAPKSNAGFSSKGKSPSTAGQSAAAEAAKPTGGQPKTDPRDDRFARRDRHQTVSLNEAFKGCGTRLTAGTAEVMWKPGEATIGNTCRCNNVHTCPWCMSRILAVRSSNVQLAADGLADAGYGLHLGTNTLRHFERMAFGTVRKGMRHGLVAVLHDGWKGAYGSSGRRWRTMRDDFGIIGYERAFEDTFGWGSGWHLHWHTLWVTREVLGPDAQAAFRDALAGAWAAGVEAAGGYTVSETCDRPGCSCEGKGHGTDVRPLNGTDAADGDAGKQARYLYKDGDKTKGGVAKIGLELAGQNFKAGRGDDRLGPLDLGDAAAAELQRLRRPGPFVEKYREREFGVFQVRKHYRSQNLNRLIKELGIQQDVRTEEEITDDTEGLVAIAVIPAYIWYRYIARVAGRRLDLIKVAETYGLPGVRRLVESWGLVWGKDVLDPPAPEAPAAPGDLDADQRKFEVMSEEEAAFREARRKANEARTNELAASLDRVRQPKKEAIRPTISLRKPLKPKPVTVDVKTPPPGTASTVCRRCKGKLAPVLQPWGQHPGDCLRVDTAVA